MECETVIKKFHCMNEDDNKFEKAQRELTHSHELQDQKDPLDGAREGEGGL